jgi:hypothetical protein
MDNRVFYKTVEEIRQQCRFAQLAFVTLRTSLNEQDPERCFLHVHTFLFHATMVSRFLWPARADSRERGEKLREALKVEPDSFVLPADMRRQAEGFDEAYEDWLNALDNPGYMDMNLMPAGTISGFKADTFQRSLDPETFKLILRGAECDLRRVSDELRKIESAIQLWLRTHNPW